MRHPFVQKGRSLLSKDNQLPEYPQEERIDLDEYVALQRELDELRKEHGIDPPKKEGGISRMISAFFERKDNKPKVTISKKKHLWTAILLGWAGGHRFQAKQYGLGFLYLFTCWSGFSMAMTIIDLLVIIPIPADENGNIVI